jgi:Uma2 family endonuclease
MSIEPTKQNEQMSLEKFFALVESHPERRYKYIDGYAYMVTGGSPDYAIIGANLISILSSFLRKCACIIYNSDAYVQLPDKRRAIPCYGRVRENRLRRAFSRRRIGE